MGSKPQEAGPAAHLLLHFTRSPQVLKEIKRLIGFSRDWNRDTTD